MGFEKGASELRGRKSRFLTGLDTQFGMTRALLGTSTR